MKIKFKMDMSSTYLVKRRGTDTPGKIGVSVGGSMELESGEFIPVLWQGRKSLEWVNKMDVVFADSSSLADVLMTIDYK